MRIDLVSRPSLRANSSQHLHRQALQLTARALRLVAETAACADAPNLAKARTLFRGSVSRAADLKMPLVVAHAHLGLGAMYARAAMKADAHPELTNARELFRSLGLTFWCERADQLLNTLADIR